MTDTGHRMNKQRGYFKKKYTRSREACIAFLGSKCARCKYEDVRALQIDHKNGGGSREAKKSGGAYYSNILKKLLGGSEEYQILCANCNQIKKNERNEI